MYYAVRKTYVMFNVISSMSAQHKQQDLNMYNPHATLN